MSGLKLDKILVPTDLSELSHAAIDAATDFAIRFESRVTLLHVCEAQSAFRKPPLRDVIRRREQVQRDLDAVKRRFRVQSEPPLRTTIVENQPAWRAICEYAHVHRYDLIVIAARGHSQAHRHLLGSVAEGVVHHAFCRVLLV